MIGYYYNNKNKMLP